MNISGNSSRTSSIIKKIIVFFKSPWNIIFIAGTLVLLLPLAVIILNALLSVPEGTAKLASDSFFRYSTNTFILVFFIGMATFILGTSFAYLITQYDFPGRKFFSWALILPLAIPPYILGYTYKGIFDYTGAVQVFLRETLKIAASDIPHIDILNHPFLILVFSLSFYPYVYIIVKASMEKQSMRIREISRLHGYSDIKSFFNLIIPLSRPAIAAGLSLVIMETLNDYGTVTYFGIDTFTSGIFRAWLSSGDRNFALKIAGILLLVVVFLLYMEKLSRKNARYDFTGMTYIPVKRKKLSKASSLCAIIFIILILSPGFFIPVIQQIFWLFQSLGKMSKIDFISPLLNTLNIAFLSVILIMITAVFLKYVNRINPKRVIDNINKINTVGYAVPGAIIALGIMILFTTIDRFFISIGIELFNINPGLILSQSIAMLIFGLVFRFLTIGFNNIESGFSKISRSVHEASRTLGVHPLKTFFKIDAPLIMPSIISGSILVFMELIKELPLSLILRPFNFDTLATRAYEYASDEMLKESSYFSLIIVLIGSVLIYVVSNYSKFFKKFRKKEESK